MNHFDKGIERIINKLQTDSYAIIRGDIICSCVDYATKQANPDCPKCLGLGRNLRIKSIKAAIRTSEGSFQNMAVDEKSVVYKGYMTERYSRLLSKDDVVVEGMNAYHVTKKSGKRSDSITPVYSVVFLAPKKKNPEKFIRKFYEVMNK